MRDALVLICVLLVAWAPGLALLLWVTLLARRLGAQGRHLNRHCAQDAQHRQVTAQVLETLRLHDQLIQALGRGLTAHEEGRPWLS